MNYSRTTRLILEILREIWFSTRIGDNRSTDVPNLGRLFNDVRVNTLYKPV